MKNLLRTACGLPTLLVSTAILLVSTSTISPVLAGPLQRHEGELRPGHDIRIELPTGERYLEGSLQLDPGQQEGERYRLLLQTPDGERSLLPPGVLNGDFSVLLPEKGTSLQLHSEDFSGRYQLRFRREPIAGWQQADEPADTPQSPRLQKLLQDIAHHPGHTAGLEQRFWQEIQDNGGTPLIEPISMNHSRLTFLWRGAQHNVRLLGAPATDSLWLHRLPKTDIWYRSIIVPNSLRLSYQFAPDIPALPPIPEADPEQNAFRQRRALRAVLTADPFNPKRYGDESLVTLPQAPLQIGVYPDARPAQLLRRFDFQSRILGNKRPIWIYQAQPTQPQPRSIQGPAPRSHTGDAGHDSMSHDPGGHVQETAPSPSPRPLLLYLFDAGPYLHTVNTPVILDTLANRLQRPITAVFIDNLGGEVRSRELPPNPDFARMMAEELPAFVTRHTGLQVNHEHTIIAGSSYGGLAASYIAFQHPKVFGNVLSLSGSHWWRGQPGSSVEHGVPALIAHNPRPGIRWFISAGIYEGARNGTRDILTTSRQLHEILQRQGQYSVYREYAGGHDYAIWQGALGDGLMALFGPSNPQLPTAGTAPPP